MIVNVNFKNEFLNEVLLSFRKRQKAIKYKVHSFDIQKVIEVSDSQAIEKIELYITSMSSPCYYIYIWEDRWVSFEAISYNSDKKQSWFYEGRFVHPNGPREIVVALEVSIASAFEEELPVKVFENIWFKILASGPSLI